MGEQGTIRIVIVDDHPIVREGFGSMIATEPDMAVVAGARDGQEAIRLFRQHRPDGTLMDPRERGGFLLEFQLVDGMAPGYRRGPCWGGRIPLIDAPSWGWPPSLDSPAMLPL